MSPTQQEVHDAFNQVYSALNQAFWFASTLEVKSQIKNLTDSVDQILDELDKADIKARTSEYNALSATVDQVMSQLKALQSGIQGIIHNVQVAADVAQSISVALGITDEFFKTPL